MAYIRSTQTAILVARDSSAGKSIRSTQTAILVARKTSDLVFSPGEGSFTFTGYAPNSFVSFAPLPGEFGFTGRTPTKSIISFIYNVSSGLGLSHVWSSQANKAATTDGIFNLLDNAIAGQISVDVEVDDDLALTADEVKNIFIEVTDTGVVLSTTRSVYVPSGSRIWWVKNSTAEDLTFTPVFDTIYAGTTATVTAGKNALLRVDGLTAYVKELD